MKWIKEIKKVGFTDWLWFVVWLKRDEFNSKLNIGYYLSKHQNDVAEAINHCTHDRWRAHNIDLKLKDMYENNI